MIVHACSSVNRRSLLGVSVGTRLACSYIRHMSAITDLTQLLIHMEPCLQDDEFVFCTFPDKRYGAYCELEPLCAFQEKEGLTLILPRSQADRVGISYDGSYRAITLQVHSSLEAVGLTAAVAAKLTANNISANFVAAYHHDHIFVSTAQAKQAVQALRDLSAESVKRTEVVEHVQGTTYAS